MSNICYKLAIGFCWVGLSGFDLFTVQAFGQRVASNEISIVEKATHREYKVAPERVILSSPESSQQILVEKLEGRFRRDMTREVTYRCANPNIALITRRGKVIPLREGNTEIRILYRNSLIQTLPVSVTGLKNPTAVSFRHQVLPIFTKAGCNSGGCHGKAEGQNGFRLSVFGFDPLADYDAITKESRARRVNLTLISKSLLLQKATSESPHAGGERFQKQSLWYRRIHRWIAEGAMLDSDSANRIVSIEINPSSIDLAPRSKHQLQITAIDSNGNRHCVTQEAEYSTNNDRIAKPDTSGLLTVGDTAGESAILVRYMGHVSVCRVTVPQPGVEFQRPPEFNFVDKLVLDKLSGLGIPPGGVANDATFMRRVYLDTIGTLPTPIEVRRFLKDTSKNKRRQLIEFLLDHDEYSKYWALRWADTLRVDKAIVAPQGAVAMTRWLETQFKKNTPYDQFVSAILTAKGNTYSKTPAAFYQVHNDPEQLARTVSKIFMGVRLECAQCHQHPFENLGQQEYYAFAGFFTGVSHRKTANGSYKITVNAGSNLKHPRTGLPVEPAGFDGKTVELKKMIDRRVVFADWLTSDGNPYFAQMMVNRLWAHYLGLGLIEPIDDIRATNPATNEKLLNALARHFVNSGYDIKVLTKTILQSRTYQLDTRSNEFNSSDEQNFSHAIWKPLPAEVLLDAITQATGIAQEFNGLPVGIRATHIWDNRQPSYFFKIFGRPQRVSVCECERGSQPSITQALHMMNSPELVRKIRHRDGLAAKLTSSEKTPAEVVEHLFLATLSRFPSPQESALMKQVFSEHGSSRKDAIQDVFWTLINTREFVFNH